MNAPTFAILSHKSAAPSLLVGFQQPDVTPKIQPQNPGGEPGEPGTVADPKEGTGGPTATENCLTSPTTLMMLGFLAIFYFLLLRPQRKQEQQRKAMIAALQKGAKVVTTGGMHGRVTKVDAQTIVLRIDSISVTIDKAAIQRVVGDDAPAVEGQAGK